MEAHLLALGWLWCSQGMSSLEDLLLQVRNHHLVLGSFIVPELKEVEGMMGKEVQCV